MAERPAIDAARVIADLRELERRTGDERGAQRLCWSPTLARGAGAPRRAARASSGSRSSVDEAGNLWARLEGEDPTPGAGARLAPGLGPRRRLARRRARGDGGARRAARLGGAGRPPPRPLALVDWADEEGARFGRSLFGSSAFAGTLDPAAVAGLRDADGRPIAEVLAENGVELEPSRRVRRAASGLGAYLELHIEQGPRMEAEGLRAAAVNGCVGVERVRFVFRGQAAHAGTTPMDAAPRRGPRRGRGRARDRGDPASSRAGWSPPASCGSSPGSRPPSPGGPRWPPTCATPSPSRWPGCSPPRVSGAAEIAARRGCELGESPVWRIEPIPFDPGSC